MVKTTFKMTIKSGYLETKCKEMCGGSGFFALHCTNKSPYSCFMSITRVHMFNYFVTLPLLCSEQSVDLLF